MQTKPVVAIDPGYSIGIALRFPSGEWTTTTLNSNEALWILFKEHTLEVVIAERFVATLISGPGLTTVELYGSIQGICYVQDVKFVSHTPQYRYPWMVESKRMLRGKSHTPHEVDALAHLLGWEEMHQ